MHRWDLSEREHRIFLDALQSYADACTLPDLTPSCPYYRLTDDGPSCEWQCWDVLDRHGGATRPVREHVVGGLVLTGVELPLAAVAGAQDYDARQ